MTPRAFPLLTVIAHLFVVSSSASADTLISQGLPSGAYTAGSSYLQQTPDKSFDGDSQTSWNAGGPSGWIEVDLGQTLELSRVTMQTRMTPGGTATHQLWISGAPMQDETTGAVLIRQFSGTFQDLQTLEHVFDLGTSAQYLQVRTVNSVSWVSWSEIQVFSGDAEPETPAQLVEVTNFPDPQSISGTVEVTNFPAVQPAEITNLPLDDEGNLRISDAQTTPKTMTIDTGDLMLTESPTSIGPFDLEGYDTVSIQVIPVSLPGSIALRPAWRNASDAPFALTFDDCSGSGGSTCTGSALETASDGGMNTTPDASALRHYNVLGRELQLVYRALDNVAGTYVLRIVIHMRRIGL